MGSAVVGEGRVTDAPGKSPVKACIIRVRREELYVMRRPREELIDRLSPGGVEGELRSIHACLCRMGLRNGRDPTVFGEHR